MKMIASIVCVLTVVLADGCRASSSSFVTTPATAIQGTPASEMRIRDLLSSPPDLVQVNYNWTGDVPGGGIGKFILRRRGGRERWDWVPAIGAPTGDLYVNSGGGYGTCRAATFVDPSCGTGTAGNRWEYSCLWLGESKESALTTSCGAGPDTGSSIADALYLAFDSRITNPLPARKIAGVDAACYAFENFDKAHAEACVDPTQHLLLYVSEITGLISKSLEILEATAVTNTPSEIGDASLDGMLLPAGHTGRDIIVPRSALTLPPEFQTGM